MKYLNNLFINLRKFVIVYALIAVLFVFWVVFTVMKTPVIKTVSTIPSYQINLIDSINTRLNDRVKISAPERPTLQENDFGKAEPFR